MVRAEALKTLCKVARRADEDRLPLLAAMALAGDKVLIKIKYIQDWGPLPSEKGAT